MLRYQSIPIDNNTKVKIMPYYSYPNLYDMHNSVKIYTFIHNMVCDWPAEHFVTETEDQCPIRYLPSPLIEITGQVSFGNRMVTYDLNAMLARRQRTLEYLKTTSMHNLYLKMINSPVFIETVRACSIDFFNDLSGIETIQTIAFLKRNKSLSGETAPWSWDELFSFDPTIDDDGNRLKTVTFQATYELCKLLLNPRSDHYDLWTEIRNAKDDHIVVLEEDIDDLECLIEQATETA